MAHRQNAPAWAGRKYYIGGKSYEPDRSTLICRHIERHPEKADMLHFFGAVEFTDLYATEAGAFFMVMGDPDNREEKVVVVDRAAALLFTDQFASGIITENFDKVFGTPENG